MLRINLLIVLLCVFGCINNKPSQSAPSNNDGGTSTIQDGFGALCEHENVYVLPSGIQDDDDAIQKMASYVKNHCTQSHISTLGVDEDTPGNATILVSGGPYTNQFITSIQNTTQGIAFSNNGNQCDLIDVAGQKVALAFDASEVTDTHDFLVVEAIANPIESQLVIIMYGVNSPGTSAAIDYVITHDMSKTRWLILEWHGSDQYSVLASSIQ